LKGTLPFKTQHTYVSQPTSVTFVSTRQETVWEDTTLCDFSHKVDV